MESNIIYLKNKQFFKQFGGKNTVISTPSYTIKNFFKLRNGKWLVLTDTGVLYVSDDLKTFNVFKNNTFGDNIEYKILSGYSDTVSSQVMLLPKIKEDQFCLTFSLKVANNSAVNSEFLKLTLGSTEISITVSEKDSLNEVSIGNLKLQGYNDTWNDFILTGNGITIKLNGMPITGTFNKTSSNKIAFLSTTIGIANVSFLNYTNTASYSTIKMLPAEYKNSYSNTEKIVCMTQFNEELLFATNENNIYKKTVMEGDFVNSSSLKFTIAAMSGNSSKFVSVDTDGIFREGTNFSKSSIPTFISNCIQYDINGILYATNPSGKLNKLRSGIFESAAFTDTMQSFYLLLNDNKFTIGNSSGFLCRITGTADTNINCGGVTEDTTNMYDRFNITEDINHYNIQNKNKKCSGSKCDDTLGDYLFVDNNILSNGKYCTSVGKQFECTSDTKPDKVGNFLMSYIDANATTSLSNCEQVIEYSKKINNRNVQITEDFEERKAAALVTYNRLTAQYTNELNSLSQANFQTTDILSLKIIVNGAYIDCPLTKTGVIPGVLNCCSDPMTGNPKLMQQCCKEGKYDYSNRPCNSDSPCADWCGKGYTVDEKGKGSVDNPTAFAAKKTELTLKIAEVKAQYEAVVNEVLVTLKPLAIGCCQSMDFTNIDASTISFNNITQTCTNTTTNTTITDSGETTTNTTTDSTTGDNSTKDFSIKPTTTSTIKPTEAPVISTVVGDFFTGMIMIWIILSIIITLISITIFYYIYRFLTAPSAPNSFGKR